ncbi:MAG: hypothetical protein MJ151_03425, partial [Lachnospiraceae bacterium]|nr:hypothetical protein [Lachnospiraceae bacterium]
MVLQNKNVKCSITIFCSIALLLIISLLFSLTEMCRMRVCKLYMQLAANSATDSLFSLYHRKLWDDYHVFGLESFDDNILKSEYEAYLMPYIKDKNDKYINNHYIANIKSEDISFTKEYLLDNDYFEREILSYMKYGMVNGIIKFASKEYDIRKDSDKEKIYEDMSGAMKEHKDTTLYQKIYDKYFYFKNDIKILEGYARDAMNYVSNYNEDVRSTYFSTSKNSSTANNNYSRLNSIENKLSNVKGTL